jgi:hypothetical protein
MPHCPDPHEPGGMADLPSEQAQLKITAERDKGITAVGIVPPADARHLISTFGITASVVTSVVGAAAALPADPYIALAELVLGLIASALIAVCSRGQRQARTMAAVAETAASPSERRNSTAGRIT